MDIFDLASLTEPEHIGFFNNPAQSTQHNMWFDSGVVAIHGYQGLWLVQPRLGERRP